MTVKVTLFLIIYITNLVFPERKSAETQFNEFDDHEVHGSFKIYHNISEKVVYIIFPNLSAVINLK